MNATSALVLVMILAFAADRVAKAALFALSLLPAWRRWFPDPEPIQHKPRKVQIRRRHLIAYTAVVGSIAAVAVWWVPELRIIQMLSGPDVSQYVDIAVTVLVVMGGSDLLSRIVQISGLGESAGQAAAGEASHRDRPVEIVGRLVLESDGSTALPPEGGPSREPHNQTPFA